MAATKNTEIRNKIIALLKRSKDALSRNDIAAKLSVDAKKLPLAAMRSEGTIKSTGATRACVYSAV